MVCAPGRDRLASVYGLHDAADHAPGADGLQHGAHRVGALLPREFATADLRLCPELFAQHLVGQQAFKLVDDHDELIGQLDTLLTDHVLREQLGAKAQARSGEFSWQQSADAMRTVLESVHARRMISGVV